MVDNKNVLIVDYPRSSQANLISVLEKEGYTVITACSSELTFKRWQSENPDLILLNTEIQGVEGFKFCRSGNARITFLSIPIYLLSNKCENDIIMSCLQLGATGYLVKPFNEVELNLSIRDFLNNFFGAVSTNMQMAIA